VAISMQKAIKMSVSRAVVKKTGVMYFEYFARNYFNGEW
jgi:hypothetical protein